MKKICISKNWTMGASGINGWINVDLPNDYSITQPRDPQAPGGASNGFFKGGHGTYIKKLDIPSEPKHYILDVDGSYMLTTVMLNNIQLAKHPHGYTPLLVDLTEHIWYGSENELKLKTNALQCSTRWYSGAGIYRDVFLWEGGDIRIEPWDVFVTTPTLDTAKANYDISSDRDAEVLLCARAIDEDGSIAAEAKCELSLSSGKRTHAELKLSIPNAKLWDIGDAHLYTLHTDIIENGSTVESDDTEFGIRTITANAKDGLLINGRSVKLRGGCIHHDHGVLGAAEYPTACKRKLEKLQSAGFNAVRIAHNPPSTILMELCDRMGIIVMDEAFDCWRLEKGGEFNYHVWFDDWWARDIAAMVKRDRKHPSVIAFSIGNEIPESDGLSDGDEWSERLSKEIRKYDDTRLVTSATFQMGNGATWAERTKGYYAPLDICGYNYLYNRYESDHELFPERVIWGSETHAIHFYDSWQTVLRNPYVIGDFTWTAYDNLGEAGTGRSLWARDGHIPGISLAEYPWRSCYQGDFDLCGYRRPQSYFREAVWIGGVTKLYTTHPEHYGEDFSGTGWHWYDVLDSWSFDDKYIGKPVKCEVYTDADEVEFFVNRRSVGRSAVQKAIAVMDIPYERGELSVVSYKDGKKWGEDSIHSVKKAFGIQVEPETTVISADNRDLCYFDITVVDENGDRVPDARIAISCMVSGGELCGIFSGDPKNEDQYGSNCCHTFEGRAVAIVKSKTPGAVTIMVGSDTLKAGSAVISCIAK